MKQQDKADNLLSLQGNCLQLIDKHFSALFSYISE